MYNLPALPTGFVLCTSAKGAMKLLDRSRGSISKDVAEFRLGGIKAMGNIFIPVNDIAFRSGLTPRQTFNRLLALELPILQLYVDDGYDVRLRERTRNAKRLRT